MKEVSRRGSWETERCSKSILPLADVRFSGCVAKHSWFRNCLLMYRISSNFEVAFRSRSIDFRARMLVSFLICLLRQNRKKKFCLAYLRPDAAAYAASCSPSNYVGTNCFFPSLLQSFTSASKSVKSLNENLCIRLQSARSQFFFLVKQTAFRNFFLLFLSKQTQREGLLFFRMAELCTMIWIHFWISAPS